MFIKIKYTVVMQIKAFFRYILWHFLALNSDELDLKYVNANFNINLWWSIREMNLKPPHSAIHQKSLVICPPG